MHDLIISEDNTLIVTTRAGLRQELHLMLTDLGVIKVPGEVLTASVYEVTTRTAKKMLKDKGWRVSSNQAFKKTMDQYGINPVKRGKEYWFSFKDIDSIPSK